MNILVTGGLGFIGSNFILEVFKNYDYNILNYDKCTYSGNPQNLNGINQSNRYTFVKGDICNKDFFYNTILDFRPDVIVNFAAESHVDRSIDSPLDFIKTNIMGTACLLQASLDYFINENKNFQFIHISTDEVFGELGNDGLFSNTSPYNPKSPYSASKASSDHLVRAWNHTYGLPVKITNCSNNYGPFQFPEKLIPLMIIKCLNQEPLPVYGQGLNVRDWIFVTDHCSAIMEVIDNGKDGNTYLIGGGNEYTNIEIVNKICSILDKLKPRTNGKKYNELISYVSDRPGHDFRYAIDASKIKNDLDWEPKYKFNDAISKTVDWYIENELWWKNILNKKYQLNRLGGK